jgi:uncharacterized membrane protein
MQRKLPATLTIMSNGDFLFRGYLFLFLQIRIDRMTERMNRKATDMYKQ